MIDFSTYTTEDPFMISPKNQLFESRGIPNILKEMSEIISSDIIGNENKFQKIYDFEKNNFISSISVEIKYHSDKEIYATSEFGIYTPVGKRLKGSKISIWMDIQNYDKIDLKRVITHELLHIYEVYNRIIGGSKKDLQWQLNNILIKIRGKYKDPFIRDLCYLIYLSMDQEINARVSETYSILIENKTINKDILIDKLKLTSAWKYSEYLTTFDYKIKTIDYRELIKFFTELNTLVRSKFKEINFNIYKIPNSEKECKEVLKGWIVLFRKKGKYFQHKLMKIIDEVINDVKMIESSYIQYDESKRLSKKYIFKYDRFLERNSKLLKLLR